MVSQLDCLLSHTDTQVLEHRPPQQHRQQHKIEQGRQHVQAGSIQQLREQHWGLSSQQQQQQQQGQEQSGQQTARPASAAAGLRQQPGLQCTGRPQSAANPKSWGRQQHNVSGPAGSLQQYAGRLDAPISASPGHQQGGKGGLSQQQQQQQGLQGEVLRHKTTASLLAASVMWQCSSEAAFRPPLRQCLTSAEIAAQRGCVAEDGQ